MSARVTTERAREIADALAEPCPRYFRLRCGSCVPCRRSAGAHEALAASSRDILADLVDARDENARLVLAITDRKGAMESVPPKRVQTYLASHGWTMRRALGPPLTVFPLELWEHAKWNSEVHVLLTTEPDDYAECMSRVAFACGAVEARDPLFVMAEWLDERSK